MGPMIKDNLFKAARIQFASLFLVFTYEEAKMYCRVVAAFEELRKHDYVRFSIRESRVTVSYLTSEDEFNSITTIVNTDYRTAREVLELKKHALEDFINANPQSIRDVATEIAKWGLSLIGPDPDLPPPRKTSTPTPISTPPTPSKKLAPAFYAKLTIQIKHNVYGGYNIFLYEERPNRPWRFEKLTTGIEPRQAAIDAAKSYAMDYSARTHTAVSNPIRVLDERGVCLTAYKNADEVSCPPSILSENPIPDFFKTALIYTGIAGAVGAVLYYFIAKNRWKRVTSVPANARIRVSTLDLDKSIDNLPNWSNVVAWYGNDSLIPVDWPSDDPYPRAISNHYEAVTIAAQSVFPPNSAVWMYS